MQAPLEGVLHAVEELLGAPSCPGDSGLVLPAAHARGLRAFLGAQGARFLVEGCDGAQSSP